MLTEVDIFKICLKEPKILKTMDKLTELEFPTVKDKIKNYVKIFYRVYNGFTKYIKAQTIQGRLISFSLLGSFYPLKNEDTQGTKDVWFTPNSNFLDDGNFHFKTDEFNKSPYECPEDLKRIKMNVGSIAHVCSISVNTAMFVLKKIMHTLTNLDQDIKLNLRIGFLKIERKELSFIPNSKHARCFSIEKTAPGLMSPMSSSFHTRDFMSRKHKGSSYSVYSTIRVPKTSMSNRKETNRFINPSNPNPQDGVPRYLPRKKESMLKRAKNAASNTLRENPIPYPFLSSFLASAEKCSPGEFHVKKF
jgi:hypothetical protein